MKTIGNLQPRPGRRAGSGTVAIVAGIVLIALALCCGAVTLGGRWLGNQASTIVSGPREAVLTVAYSPEKAALITELADEFNASAQVTPGGAAMRVALVEMDPDEMVERALEGEFQALTPDSSIWLDQLDQSYAEQVGDSNASLVGQTVRYAVSPVVIAMWRDVAEPMGYGSRPLGWSDLLARAQADPDFKWSHPSTSSAAGLLATLAEFYAGAGVTRGLTPELVQAEATLEYVTALERSVRYYGEGELAVVQRVLEQGRGYLDAFVCQEQLVIYANQRGADLVAVYPVEGTAWEDHPLALLETGGLSDDQRLVFNRFANYLLSQGAQQQVLAAGYRPGDVTIPLGDPIVLTNGVDPSQPQTTLQIPGAQVMEVVREVWWYTKRHTNVYLVVDTSGSMAGGKMEAVREALSIFIDQIEGEQESVGLVQFSSGPQIAVPLGQLETNRDRLNTVVDGLEAQGDTALIDAVWVAYDELQKLGDPERINAIVVMTDGLENNSRHRLDELEQLMQAGNAGGVPVVVFAIGYGSDADWQTLQVIADASDGQVFEGSIETIRDLYKVLSTYF